MTVPATLSKMDSSDDKQQAIPEHEKDEPTSLNTGFFISVNIRPFYHCEKSYLLSIKTNQASSVRLGCLSSKFGENSIQNIS